MGNCQTICSSCTNDEVNAIDAIEEADKNGQRKPVRGAAPMNGDPENTENERGSGGKT